MIVSKAKEYDIHGLTFYETQDLVHRIVGETRLGGEETWVKIITGNGSLQKEVLSILKDYKLKPEIQWGNSGCVNVLVI